MKAAVKKLTVIFLCLLILLASLMAAGCYFEKNYVVLNGKPYARTVENLTFAGEKLPNLDTLAELKALKQLDLRNTTLSLGEHEWLQLQLPDCRILWQIEFQGKLYMPDTEKLTLTSLKPSDIVILDFLTELREIDARDCRDYETLAKLIDRRPDCQILTQAKLGNRELNQDTQELTLRDGDADQLLQILGAFPGLQKIEFTGKLPETKKLNALREKFPLLEINWQVRLNGKNYDKNLKILDLSCREIPDIEQLREKLLYFPFLQEVDFRGTELSEEDKNLLMTHYPQLKLQFDYEIQGIQADVHTEVLDLSGKTGITIGEIEKAVPYLPRLRTIYLCDCGLPNEKLAELNRRLKNVRVIWNVQVGGGIPGQMRNILPPINGA